MKKIRILLLILILLFTAGCNKINIINSKKEKGRIYNIVSLQDKGINMFTGIVPEGWTSKIYTQDLVNSAHPFVETIVLTNPEGTAQITILSQNSYVENTKYNEGENKDYYTTYLHYMNSNTYSDYFMGKVFNGAKFVKEEKFPDEFLNELATLHNQKVELGKKDAALLQANTAGVNLYVDGVEYSASKRQYQNNNVYYETTTCISAIGTTLNSHLSSILNSYAVSWYIPYTIIYEATSKEDFDKYYDDYNFIVANSSFTIDYYQLVEYVSSAIVNAVTTIYTERSKIALQAMNDYIDSNYSSTSAQSTNDKVMEMWDDVIKEQDSYITEDGQQIKTSIMNDTVAQNGNEIYVGSKAGIPNGFNELAKGYK